MLLGSTAPFQNFREPLSFFSILAISLVLTTKSLLFFIKQKILNHFDSFFSLTPSSDQITLFYLSFLELIFSFPSLASPYYFIIIFFLFFCLNYSKFFLTDLPVFSYNLPVNPRNSSQNDFPKGQIISYHFHFQNPAPTIVPLEKHNLLCTAYRTLYDLAYCPIFLLWEVCVLEILRFLKVLCSLLSPCCFKSSSLSLEYPSSFCPKKFLLILHRPTQKSLHLRKTMPFLFPLETVILSLLSVSANIIEHKTLHVNGVI